MTKVIRRKLPPFVQEIEYQGAAYFYFRRPGFERVKLPGLPWSPEFMTAHQAAMTGQVLPTVGAKRKAGSFAALAESYFASTAFLRMKARERSDIWRPPHWRRITSPRARNRAFTDLMTFFSLPSSSARTSVMATTVAVFW